MWGCEMQDVVTAGRGSRIAGRKTRNWNPAATRCGLWMALIFLTSCYHITLRGLLHWVEHTSSPSFNLAFRRIWLADCLYFIKGWHFLEFATLLTLGTTTLRRWRGWDVVRSVRWALPLTILFAATDEWHQTFVRGRGGRVTDVLIDTAGACFAAFVLAVVLPRVRHFACLPKLVSAPSSTGSRCRHQERR